MKRKLAIIEDSELITELYCKFLEKRFEAEVIIFHSAEDFLSSDLTPDMLLLDYFLDKGDPYAMTGLELLEELKERNRQMPVIVVSGMRNAHVLKQLRDFKIISFIDKDSPDFWKNLEMQMGDYFNTK